MRALLSVASRDGISTFARELQALGVEIYATDGTRDHLAEDGIEVGSVSDLTNVPPLVGGQVKTFHPAVYAGILARRDDPAQLEELAAQGIGAIDIVVVNIKPFAPQVGARQVALADVIELIDVGGVALLGPRPATTPPLPRSPTPPTTAGSPASCASSARSPASSASSWRPRPSGSWRPITPRSPPTSTRSPGTQFPSRLAMVLEKVEDLRYGENPHQRAAFYRETTHRSGSLADARQLQGGQPSFNNLLDLDAAYRIAKDFTAPTVAIVKHTDPVGMASHDELVEAYRHALETDPVAAFGGIVGVNRELDGATAREIAANSYEAVVAPGFSESALGILRQKTGLELLAVPPDPTEGLRDYGIANLDFKRVSGGLLVESQDSLELDKKQLQVVTRRRPTLEELTDLLFAWRTVRHVRSNAIVLARSAATVGIGAAQASRQVSVEIALRRAGDRARMSVMASDAYFPFPDGIALAANSGVSAIIQPGGSIRDEMAIEVADRHHLAMVFTGRRHFRH